MTSSFDVGEADFSREVLDLSRRVPVLVDFWAPWCGPCRSLKPLLEKLAVEYGGRFVLAKVNSDEAQALAARFAVRSIPAVKLFVDGEVVDEFMGAQPEGEVRAFLDRHLPDEAERLRQEAAAIAPPLERAEVLREAVRLSGGRPAIVMDLAAAQIDAGLLDEAAAGLDTVDPRARDERWHTLASRLALVREAPGVDETALEARIAADPRDFEARFALAASRAGRGEWSSAFGQLLEIVLRDRAAARGQARDKLVEWFALCPDARPVAEARRQLSSYLN